MPTAPRNERCRASSATSIRPGRPMAAGSQPSTIAPPSGESLVDPDGVAKTIDMRERRAGRLRRRPPLVAHQLAAARALAPSRRLPENHNPYLAAACPPSTHEGALSMIRNRRRLAILAIAVLTTLASLAFAPAQAPRSQTATAGSPSRPRPSRGDPDLHRSTERPRPAPDHPPRRRRHRPGLVAGRPPDRLRLQ